jgi:hypothetical protein
LRTDTRQFGPARILATIVAVALGGALLPQLLLT